MKVQSIEVSDVHFIRHVGTSAITGVLANGGVLCDKLPPQGHIKRYTLHCAVPSGALLMFVHA
jgi:hypothetical protein